ncbi:MAG: hypothetical protein QOD28_3251 [Acidobacteriota bacterium]|nr:hypothetical protein [Acidobacteriota bacterium]
MKRFALTAALLATVAFAPTLIQTKATSPQASGVTRHAYRNSKIHSARMIERGFVKSLPVKPVQRGRCQPYVCCQVVMNRQCQGDVCGYASWSGHGCGRRYSESGTDAGCCNVVTV